MYNQLTMHLPSGQYDLLIIGGGINGLGVAADAAARGLSVLIVEKGDWGGGTTSASSRLIHGGLRYLQYGEIDLVRESLHERGRLVRRRPHLVRPLSLLIPTYKGQPTPRAIIGIGLLLYDLLARDKAFPHPSPLSRQTVLEQEPGLNPDNLTGGFRYPDAQVEFPERVCVELMQEARQAGAQVRNHCRVLALREDGGNVVGARLRDNLTGEQEDVSARLTVNAGGPWVDVVNRTLGTPPPSLIGGTWGTHLVLPRREAGPHGPLYATARRDNRPFFLLPWDQRLLVGTTDVKFTGPDPDMLAAQPWEIDYLLEETHNLFPGAAYTEADVETTTVGVRPLPASDKTSGSVTRRHFLVDHGKRDGIGGLISLVGGKLTTYRSLGEEVVDAALKLLKHAPVPCPTRDLPDAPSVDVQEADTRARLAELGLDPSLAPRLVGLYGPQVGNVLARVRDNPTLGQPLTPTCPQLKAQVSHAREAEGARTVDDIVRRRLMLFPPPPDAIAAVRELCPNLPTQ